MTGLSHVDHDYESVTVFFYGGLIDQEVQAKVGLHLAEPTLAKIRGFTLCFTPWVNVRRAEIGVVYGLVARVSSAMLEHVYAQLQTRYVATPVVCYDQDDRIIPALCYIAPASSQEPINPDVVAALAKAGARAGFPDWYVGQIYGH